MSPPCEAPAVRRSLRGHEVLFLAVLLLAGLIPGRPAAEAPIPGGVTVEAAVAEEVVAEPVAVEEAMGAPVPEADGEALPTEDAPVDPVPPEAEADGTTAPIPEDALAEPITEVSAADLYARVLRIESSVQAYDYRAPWNAGRFGTGNGTGFVIGPNRILTNAHVVSNSRRLILRMHDDPGIYPARVLYIAHDSDLAMLELEDPAPIADLPPLELGDVPPLESEVRVIGYPVGGTRLSVTRGVVSRIDYSVYGHTGIDQRLVVQIDAAINPGNSGGPVLQGHRVVGVAFQALRQADNTGYVIPTPVIRRFLADIEDGAYDGSVDLAITTFNVFNPAQRSALGMPDARLGVYVSRVLPGGSACGVLEAGDILLEIDGHAVLADGRVELDGQMVNLAGAVERRLSGETVRVRFLRDGEEREAAFELTSFAPIRLFAAEYETRPAYAVFGGLLFQPASRNLIQAYQLQRLELMKTLEDYLPEAHYLEQEEIVVLTQVLPDPVNADLSGVDGLVVERINGQPVRRMADLKTLLFEPLEAGQLPPFTVIECRGARRPLVFESARIPDAQQRIRAQYGIARDYVLGTDAEGEW